MSLAIAVVPSVSLSRVEHDAAAIVLKSRMSLKIVYLIGVPATLFFMVFGTNILSVLYPALSPQEISISSGLVRIASFGVVLTSATQIYVSLLQGLDRTFSAIKSLFAAIVVKIAVSLVAVRFIGIAGAAVASVAMSLVSLAGCGAAFCRLTSVHVEKNIAQTLISGVIMALIGVVVREYVPTDIGVLVAGGAVCGIVYFLLVTLFGVFDEEECAFMPFGRYFARLRKKIRFWE